MHCRVHNFNMLVPMQTVTFTILQCLIAHYSGIYFLLGVTRYQIASHGYSHGRCKIIKHCY